MARLWFCIWLEYRGSSEGGREGKITFPLQSVACPPPWDDRVLKTLTIAVVVCARSGGVASSSCALVQHILNLQERFQILKGPFLPPTSGGFFCSADKTYVRHVCSMCT